MSVGSDYRLPGKEKKKKKKGCLENMTFARRRSREN